jgi:CheY-like chemotaxis protein/two-component sensor histidine kinase
MVESQQHSLDAMTNLLNSLLDISRLDAGKVEPELEDFRVQRLVDRLYAESARQARQKGLHFVADTCERVIVRSDPNLLGEIIQNFVSNAIRYTDSGEVKLTCREDGKDLWVDVVDTGVGIEPDQLDEIFREFHQVKSPGKEKEGFGLGLAIVKRMADLLEHDIDVKSAPGEGSTFSIRVPIVGKRDLSGRPDESPADDDTPTITGTILLIEDDVKVVNAWGLLLKAEGFEVVIAASAKETEAVIKDLSSSPDLIISDFHLLDNSTGVEAVAIVRRAFDRDIPAFIVTGDTSKMVQEARETPNCIIMNKPVNTDELLKNAETAIETGHVPGD